MTLQERANAGLHAHVQTQLARQPGHRSRSLLDVGAGTGAFLHRLLTDGHTQLAGIDIAVPSGANEALQGIAFHEHDLDRGAMPFPDGAMQLITCIEVIEHIESPGHLMRELSRVLAPDGLLFMTTPNVHSLQARLRFLCLGHLKQFDHLSDPTHLHPVFLHTFKRLIDRHGLEIAQAWGFPTDGSSPTSRGSLRALSAVLAGLGLRSEISGDHLCMVLRHKAPGAAPAPDKRQAVTGHYGG